MRGMSLLIYILQLLRNYLWEIKLRNSISSCKLFLWIVCAPSAIHVCDGSLSENENLINLMVQKGTLQPLPKLDNW